jgi:hypothetical protein
VRCECGCGYEGEDEVTQYLIEEAAFETAEWQERLAEVREPSGGLPPHQAAAARHAALMGKA